MFLSSLLLDFFLNNTGDNRSDDSSSSYSEVLNRGDETSRNKVVSFHQSDSDDLSLKVMENDTLRMRNPLQPFLRGQYKKLGKLGLSCDHIVLKISRFNKLLIKRCNKRIETN